MSDEEDEEIFGKKDDSDDQRNLLSDDDLSSEAEEEENQVTDDEEEEITVESLRKKRKITKNAFIDDEAELSGDDVGSEDEVDDSDEDQPDLDLVDKNASELDSEEEEEVRGFYHKQLESEDKRAVLLLKEHFEDNQLTTGQRRRRKFRWQTKELMETSLRRHYDPDDDDSQEGDDDDDDYDNYQELNPRLSRLAVKPSGAFAKYAKIDDITPFNTLDSSDLSGDSFPSKSQSVIGPRISSLNEDSSSNPVAQLMTKNTASVAANINKFVFREKELVEALSTKEVVVVSKEERERIVQREVRRVLQSKSIFDQLYS